MYDAAAGTTGIFGTITTAAAALGPWNYGKDGVPFNNGLTIVTTGNGLDAIVLYE